MKNTNITRRLSLVIACAGILTVHTNASVIFTETSDFNGSLAFIIPESLGIGANTITGSLPLEFSFGDVDVFQVNNPSLLSISSISILISEFVGTTTDPGSGTGRFEIFSPNFGSETITGNGLYTLAATLNDVSQLEFRLIGPEDFMNNESGSMNYEVTINAIPEPSSTLLMGVFALTAALRRRRNK